MKSWPLPADTPYTNLNTLTFDRKGRVWFTGQSGYYGRLDPTSGEANYQLGLALARAGRKEEATASLQKGRDLVAAADRAQLAALDAAEGRSPAGRKPLSTS